MNLYTVYMIRFTAFGMVRKYVTTSVEEMAAFCIANRAFELLGKSEIVGMSSTEINLQLV